LFLDEVGELPLMLQVKLLRVLQEKEVVRVGGTKPVNVNVRIVAATHRDIAKMVKEGAFREDLFYRLMVIPIHLPPLRERPSDIAVLARHFIDQINPRLGTSISGLGHEAIDRLLAHPWPGNVRELANVIERGMNLAQNGELGPGHIVFGRPVALLAQTAPTIAADGVGTLDAAAAAAEREVLARALAEHGSARKAAQALGVSHTTVLKKMRRYGLKP
jgi:transcriptional regulator of aroF, aroG, tyrA and aromatic amino acid transport